MTGDSEGREPVKVPTTAAFRSQLVTAEQRQLYDYWQEKRGKNPLPARADISPADFPRLLPNVSLVEPAAPPAAFTVRLAGTKLREVYGREITGIPVHELEPEAQPVYWSGIYNQVAETLSPAQGVVRAPAAGHDHLVQFWLRLPLGTADGKLQMILGLDLFVPATEMAEQQTICA
ncbi:MAG: PAS domain-containing protein [Pseudomonadota bacterium]